MDGMDDRMNNERQSRWTTKEAAYKALYPVHRAGWKELSLLKGESSQPKKPVLLFHPSSAPSSGSTSDSDHYQLHPHISLLVSISHDGPFTIASVLANSSSSSASTEHHNTLMSSS
jgi:phosphopantetheinyl transferase (holo-ACP synthase)